MQIGEQLSDEENFVLFCLWLNITMILILFNKVFSENS